MYMILYQIAGRQVIYCPITNAAGPPLRSKYSGPYLKGLAHAKIIKKSVILFRVFNMTI